MDNLSKIFFKSQYARKWNIGLQYSGVWSARRSGENLIVDLQTRLEQQTSLTMT
ncbi:hypothetical protein [Nostoc sp.]|uniref:hypothetical protein n=1 Tax=Nostoc sp. TaxID=1180 RepID=UPI003592F27B